MVAVYIDANKTTGNANDQGLPQNFVEATKWLRKEAGQITWARLML